MHSRSTTHGIDDVTYRSAGLGGRVQRGLSPALVVVDMQKGFTDPAHPLGMNDAATLGKIIDIIGAARSASVPVFYTVIAYPEGTSTPWFEKMPQLATLTEGSVWTELDDRLHRRSDEPLILKQQASAVFGTDLVDGLRSAAIDTVIVTGVTTSGCIRATVVDLVSSGFRVVVPSDAVGDRMRGPHDAALFDIEAKYGDVVDTDDVIVYLG